LDKIIEVRYQFFELRKYSENKLIEFQDTLDFVQKRFPTRFTQTEANLLQLNSYAYSSSFTLAVTKIMIAYLHIDLLSRKADFIKFKYRNTIDDSNFDIDDIINLLSFVIAVSAVFSNAPVIIIAGVAVSAKALKSGLVKKEFNDILALKDKDPIKHEEFIKTFFHSGNEALLKIKDVLSEKFIELEESTNLCLGKVSTLKESVHMSIFQKIALNSIIMRHKLRFRFGHTGKI